MLADSSPLMLKWRRMRNLFFASFCVVFVFVWFTFAYVFEANAEAKSHQQFIGDTPVGQPEFDNEYVFKPPSATDKPKFAFAILHYEGTARDDEYALAVRVLIQSIQNTKTKHDIVVFASENVRESTIHLFKRQGARVVTTKNIENPFKNDPSRRRSFKMHFEHTMNKMYIWKMVRYTRVVYLDADNIAMHNMDEMFHCGHFCAEFMNQVNFHTGLLVVKPDEKKFEELMDRLKDNSVSYDGGDQGFLCNVFRGLDSAPLYEWSKAKKAPVEKPMMRLPYAYNLNHIYYYEKMSFILHKENSERFGNLTGKYWDIPALSLAYPVTQIAKPWYWYPTFFFDLHYEWQAIRDQTYEPINWNLVFYSRLALFAILYFAGQWVLEQLLIARPPSTVGVVKVRAQTALKNTIIALGQYSHNIVGIVAGAIGTVYISVYFMCSPPIISLVAPPRFAWPLAIIGHTISSHFCISLFAILTHSSRPNLTAMIPSFAMKCIFLLILLRSAIFGQFLEKIWCILLFGGILLIYEINFYRYMAYSVIAKHGVYTPLVGVLKAPDDDRQHSSKLRKSEFDLF